LGWKPVLQADHGQQRGGRGKHAGADLPEGELGLLASAQCLGNGAGLGHFVDEEDCAVGLGATQAETAIGGIGQLGDGLCVLAVFDGARKLRGSGAPAAETLWCVRDLKQGIG
jgi:hypothetical protein